jgi:hypothetical protein
MIWQLALFDIEEYTMEIENPINVTQQQVKQIPAKPEATQIELELWPRQIVQVVHYYQQELSA